MSAVAVRSTRLQRLARLRGQASREGMALCLKWTDSCRELGWQEDQLDDLELLFWQYRDSNGRLKQPSVRLCSGGEPL